MRKLQFLLLVFSLAALFGCRKDADEATKEFLTDCKWVMVSAKVNGVESAQDYDLDDEFIFNADGSFIYHPGSVLCSEGQTGVNGTYALLKNGDQISITINQKTANFAFSGISDGKIVLSVADEKEAIEIVLRRH